MDCTYHKLSDYLISLLKVNQNADDNQERKKRFIIGICGPPGSGKTTTVLQLVKLVNDKVGCGSNTCSMLPMDGYHYYKSELQQFADPKKAFERRGSPYTFNSSKFYETLQQTRLDAFKQDVLVPSFDHSVGDPVEEDIVIHRDCELVLVEGNYLALPSCPNDTVWEWKSCVEWFDEMWYIQVDIDEAMARVHKRHMGTGLPDHEATTRIEQNDRPNAQYIMYQAVAEPHLFTRTVTSINARNV